MHLHLQYFLFTTYNLSCNFKPSAGRTNHHEGEALKNLALKKGSIQSRRLWDWMNEQADARPMYKQRSWQAVTNLRLKTASLVVRAL